MFKRQSAFIFCIYIHLVALLCICAYAQEFNDAQMQILPAYIIALKADYFNSTTCGKELQNFRDAVDQRILWSLKVKYHVFLHLKRFVADKYFQTDEKVKTTDQEWFSSQVTHFYDTSLQKFVSRYECFNNNRICVEK